MGGVRVAWRLLIAEDEKYLREKVTKNIDWVAYGYEVVVASDGEEALEIMEREQIDLLVTDIRMPGMDGIELTERAKALNEELKVIVISGHAEFELAQASIRLGVEDYLLKPFRSERLLEVVEKARAKLEARKEQLAQESKREQLARQLLEKRVSGVFGWLANPNFFLSQSNHATRHRLAEILRSGTPAELDKEIELFHAALDCYERDGENVYILLNDIVITTLTTVKDLGFELEQVVNIMSKHLPTTSQGDLADLKHWVASFLLDINELIKSRPEGDSEQLIKTMKNYVDQNYRSGVTLHALANQLNMSPSQLSKLFLSYVGENFSDYVNGLKEKAKELLKATDYRVYEIADFLGFSDAYYFSSWFKRTVGCSPTEYRDSCQERQDVL